MTTTSPLPFRSDIDPSVLYLSRKSVCLRFSISPSTVYAHVREGLLIMTKRGNRTTFHPQDVEDYAHRRTELGLKGSADPKVTERQSIQSQENARQYYGEVRTRRVQRNQELAFGHIRKPLDTKPHHNT